MNRGATGSACWLICLSPCREFGCLLGLMVCLGIGLGLGACTAPNPAYPDALVCTLGERQCSAAAERPVAQVCGRDASDNLVLIDEPCPVGSLCDAGRCAPAAGAVACSRQADCASGQSCVPLVKDGALESFCVTQKPAMTPAGDACSQDSDCQSYHCLQHPQRRSCLLVCKSDSDCQQPAHCQTLSVTITGVQGMVGSCSAP